MIAKMKESGIDTTTATGIIRARKAEFDQAILD